jgi:hypothetical protein
LRGTVGAPTVLLSAASGATTYRSGVSLTVFCARGSSFDGTTSVPNTFDCSVCDCGCDLSGDSCRTCPPPHCNPKLGCDP